MASDTMMPRLRGFMLVCILMLSVAAIGWLSSAGVKAPLLTMMGGVTIIMTLYPPRVFTMQDAGTFLGTGIAIFGGGYWLIDSIESVRPIEIIRASILAFLLIALLTFHVFVSMLIFANWGGIWNGIKAAVRKILRR